MQRYLLNVDHYEPYGNGTVFVYAGNEGDIKMFAQNTVSISLMNVIICFKF